MKNKIQYRVEGYDKDDDRYQVQTCCDKPTGEAIYMVYNIDTQVEEGGELISDFNDEEEAELYAESLNEKQQQEGNK